jgi:hypothetical protein
VSRNKTEVILDMKTTILHPIKPQTQAFPFVKPFDDYHDIEVYRHTLINKYGDKGCGTAAHNILAKELPFHENTYWGLFYLSGEEPESSSEIQILIDEV